MNSILQLDSRGAGRLNCRGPITTSSMDFDEEHLAKLLGPAGYSQQIYLNCEEADFIDSSGIRWLLVTHKRFAEAGGKLILHSLPPLVEQVLQFCKLDQILSIQRGPVVGAGSKEITANEGR